MVQPSCPRSCWTSAAHCLADPRLKGLKHPVRVTCRTGCFNNDDIQHRSAYAHASVPGIRLRRFNLCQQPCCLIQGKHSRHMPQRCPDHPSSADKNALLELALLERAKRLIRKRKLRAVFISAVYEKLGGNIPRRTPVKWLNRVVGKPKVKNGEKGGWTRSVKESGSNINRILTLILQQGNRWWESAVCSSRTKRCLLREDSWQIKCNLQGIQPY